MEIESDECKRRFHRETCAVVCKKKKPRDIVHASCCFSAAAGFLVDTELVNISIPKLPDFLDIEKRLWIFSICMRKRFPNGWLKLGGRVDIVRAH